MNKNKELYATELDQPTDATIGEHSFSCGGVTLEDAHEQGCCEQVYADWSQLAVHIDAINKMSPIHLVIKGVEDMGFLLVFKHKYETPIKVFVPCYNSQNGYYGSDLELVISKGGVKTKIDISGLVEDDIN